MPDNRDNARILFGGILCLLGAAVLTSLIGGVCLHWLVVPLAIVVLVQVARHLD